MRTNRSITLNDLCTWSCDVAEKDGRVTGRRLAEPEPSWRSRSLGHVVVPSNLVSIIGASPHPPHAAPAALNPPSVHLHEQRRSFCVGHQHTIATFSPTHPMDTDRTDENSTSQRRVLAPRPPGARHDAPPGTRNGAEGYGSRPGKRRRVACQLCRQSKVRHATAQ